MPRVFKYDSCWVIISGQQLLIQRHLQLISSFPWSHLSDRHNHRSACLKFNGRSSGNKGNRSPYSIDDSPFHQPPPPWPPSPQIWWPLSGNVGIIRHDPTSHGEADNHWVLGWFLKDGLDLAGNWGGGRESFGERWPAKLPLGNVCISKQGERQLNAVSVPVSGSVCFACENSVQRSWAAWGR